MVGHNNMWMQNGMGKMLGDFQPAFVRHFSGVVQYHFFIFYFPEQTFTIMNADGYKIKSIVRIVISFKPYRFAMVKRRIIFYFIVHIKTNRLTRHIQQLYPKFCPSATPPCPGWKAKKLSGRNQEPRIKSQDMDLYCTSLQ